VEPRAAVVELAATVALHHRVWVLSGSAESVVLPAAARLGISHVIGLRSAWAGDRLTDRVEHPVPTDEGKIRVAWWRVGRRPVFAIGDSPWDLPLLRHARVARTTGRIAGMEFPAYP
jgi:phosphoserine phosphatase